MTLPSSTGSRVCDPTSASWADTVRPETASALVAEFSKQLGSCGNLFDNIGAIFEVVGHVAPAIAVFESIKEGAGVPFVRGGRSQPHRGQDGAYRPSQRAHEEELPVLEGSGQIELLLVERVANALIEKTSHRNIPLDSRIELGKTDG